MEIFTMQQLLDLLGKAHLQNNLRSAGGTLYRSLNIYIPGVRLYSHTLYLAQSESLPENLASADDIGCILLSIDKASDHIVCDKGVNCEWAIWDESEDLIKLFNIIQNTISLQLSKDRFQQFLVSSLASNESIGMFIHQAAVMVQNPITLFDPAFKLIAMDDLGCDIDDPFCIEAKERGMLSIENVRLMKESGITETIQYTNGPALFGPNDSIKIPRLGKKIYSPQGEYLGTVAIYQCKKPFSEEDYSYIDSLGSALSVKMHYQPYINDEHKCFNSLMRLLLDGSSIKDLPSDEKKYSEKLSRYSLLRVGFLKLSDNPAWVRQGEYYRSSLFTNPNGTYTIRYHQDIVVLFVSQTHEEFSLKLEQISLQLSKFNMSMGISRSFSRISEVKSMFCEARQALSLGHKYFTNNSVFLYEHISIFKLLESMEAEVLLDYYRTSPHALLREYDSKKGTEFCNTLYQFSMEMGSHVKTAQKLFIHKNTLVYRLNKISSLTCLDLNLEKSLHDYYFSDLVYKYLKSLPPTDSSSFEL